MAEILQEGRLGDDQHDLVGKLEALKGTGIEKLEKVGDAIYSYTYGKETF